MKGDALTPRESQTLALLAEGKSNAEIAEAMGIEVKSVRTHLLHVFAKLDVKSRTLALLSAQHLGLVDIDPSLTHAAQTMLSIEQANPGTFAELRADKSIEKDSTP